MKKLVVALLATALVPSLAFAQGTVNFASTSANHQIQLPDNSPAGGVLAELLWSPDNIVPYVSIASSTTAANGFLTTPTTGVTGAATPEGATAWFIVAASDGALLIGQSAPFENLTGAPNASPPTTPAAMTGWTSPVVLSVIPEPTTFALAGLGAAALLIFRRRS